ncbi:hypothetical protein CPB83DRAFT_835600 [Crepidotus variabilis]|uniref:Uncharacterized protein n=1 Tax=Crepidotus variabilis TaxID=179855 RepID=A0A9P6EFH5_9AGAR|nr:hypothetical protein CPB83DRAFT_835600 [Crepidotus variabilis]
MFQLIGEGGAFWRVFPGVLESVEGVAQVIRHTFIEDTCDGGLANSYHYISGVELPRYHRLASKSSDRPEILKKLMTISLPLEAVRNRVKMEDTSQTTVSAEAAVSRAALQLLLDFFFLKRASSTSEHPCPSSSKTPSPGYFRESCAKCGARVFRWSTSRMKGIMEVASGLINQEQAGSRAEKFFAWSEELCYADQASVKAMVRSLQEGLRDHNDTTAPSGIRIADDTS